MASAPKKNAAARAASAPTESDEVPVAPRAVFVMPEASAEDAETSSPADGRFRRSLAGGGDSTEFPQRAGKKCGRVARGVRQGQNRRG